MKQNNTEQQPPIPFSFTIVIALLSVKLAEKQFLKFKQALTADGLDDRQNFLKSGNDAICDKCQFFNKLPILKKDIKLLAGNFEQFERNAYHWDNYQKSKCGEIKELQNYILEISENMHNETEKMFCALKSIFDDEGCVFTNSIARCVAVISLLKLNESVIRACQKENCLTVTQENTLRLIKSNQLNLYADRIRLNIFTPSDVDVMESESTKKCISTFADAIRDNYEKYFIIKNQNENGNNSTEK